MPFCPFCSRHLLFSHSQSLYPTQIIYLHKIQITNLNIFFISNTSTKFYMDIQYTIQGVALMAEQFNNLLNFHLLLFGLFQSKRALYLILHQFWFLDDGFWSGPSLFPLSSSFIVILPFSFYRNILIQLPRPTRLYSPLQGTRANSISDKDHCTPIIPNLVCF